MKRIRSYIICIKCKGDKKPSSSNYCKQCAKDYYDSRKIIINNQRKIWRENRQNPKFDCGREYENVNIQSTIEEARKLLYKFKYGIIDSVSIYQLIDIYINLFGYKSVDYYGKTVEEQIIKMLKSTKEKYMEYKADLSAKKIETTKDMEKVKEAKIDSLKCEQTTIPDIMMSQLSIAQKAADELNAEKDNLTNRLFELENLLNIQNKIVAILKGDKPSLDTRQYNRQYYYRVTKNKNKQNKNN